MLIRKIEKFLHQTGMSASRFSRATMRDPTFVAQLRKGREPRLKTEKKLEHFMNNFRDPANDR